MRSVIGGVQYESVPWDELLTLRKRAFEVDTAKRNSAEKDRQLSALYEAAGVDVLEGGPLVLQETIAELRRKAALYDSGVAAITRARDRLLLEARAEQSMVAVEIAKAGAWELTRALRLLGVEPNGEG